MLLLFFPFQDKVDFPKFEDRWKFFQNCSKSGLLYWDSDRLMQNIQDVENSKRILSTNDDNKVAQAAATVSIISAQFVTAKEKSSKVMCHHITVLWAGFLDFIPAHQSGSG